MIHEFGDLVYDDGLRLLWVANRPRALELTERRGVMLATLLAAHGAPVRTPALAAAVYAPCGAASPAQLRRLPNLIFRLRGSIREHGSQFRIEGTVQSGWRLERARQVLPRPNPRAGIAAAQAVAS